MLLICKTSRNLLPLNITLKSTYKTWLTCILVIRVRILKLVTKINGVLLDCWPFLPFPHFLDECLTAYVMPRLLFFLPQFLFHHHLRGDSCMVTAWEPQSLVTSHSMPKQKSFKSMLRYFFFWFFTISNLEKLIFLQTVLCTKGLNFWKKIKW